MIVKQMADMLNETIKPEVIGTNAEIKLENYDWVDVGISTTTPVEPVPPEPPAPVVTPYARWQLEEFSSVPQSITNLADHTVPYTANWSSGYTSGADDLPLSWGGLDDFYVLDKGGYCSIPFNYNNNFSISVAGHCWAAGSYPKKESVACALLNIPELNLVVNCLTRDPDSIEGDDKEIRLFTKLGNNPATYTASDVVENHNEYKMPAWNYTDDFNVTIEKDAESIALKVNGEVKVKWATPEYTETTNAVLGNNSYYIATTLMSFNADYSSFNIDYIE